MHSTQEILRCFLTSHTGFPPASLPALLDMIFTCSRFGESIDLLVKASSGAIGARGSREVGEKKRKLLE